MVLTEIIFFGLGFLTLFGMIKWKIRQYRKLGKEETAKQLEDIMRMT